MSFESFPKIEPKNKSTKIEFKTKEGDIVTLKFCIVKPIVNEKNKTKNEKQNQAIIFLPGVAVEADSGSVLKAAQDFANASNAETYSITTSINNAKTKNSQIPQAEAIHQFLTERGLTEVTIVGNSQGVNKALYVTGGLEKNNPEIKINGLILTNPGGLYNQDAGELTKNFILDGTIRTKPSLDLALGIGKDVVVNIAKEFAHSPLDFKEKAMREAEEAGTLNDVAKDIKTKILMVVGKNDTAFPSSKFIPDDAHDQSLASQNEREKKMGEIFTNSENVKVIEAEKLSNHSLFYARSEQIANISLYELERMNRKSEKQEENNNLEKEYSISN